MVLPGVQFSISILRSICDLHSGQKAVRLERELQFQKMSRLEIKARKNSESPICQYTINRIGAFEVMSPDIM